MKLQPVLGPLNTFTGLHMKKSVQARDLLTLTHKPWGTDVRGIDEGDASFNITYGDEPSIRVTGANRRIEAIQH